MNYRQRRQAAKLLMLPKGRGIDENIREALRSELGGTTQVPECNDRAARRRDAKRGIRRSVGKKTGGEFVVVDAGAQGRPFHLRRAKP